MPEHRGLLPLLGLACGVSVATIYYNQPLLLWHARAGRAAGARGATPTQQTH